MLAKAMLSGFSRPKTWKPSLLFTTTPMSRMAFAAPPIKGDYFKKDEPVSEVGLAENLGEDLSLEADIMDNRVPASTTLKQEIKSMDR